MIVTIDKVWDEFEAYFNEKYKGISKTQAAKDFDCFPQFLGDVLLRKKPPSKKMLAILGYEKALAYQKKAD